MNKISNCPICAIVIPKIGATDFIYNAFLVNPYTVYVLIECKGLGARLLIIVSFNNKASGPVPTIHIYHVYGKHEPRGPLFTRKWMICGCAAAKQIRILLEV